MTGAVLDRLARAVVATASRRRILGVLTGLPLAGVLAAPWGKAATAARGRTAHRHRDQHQRHHDRARSKRRQRDHRHETQSEACIPTGQKCPSKKARGKKGGKLSCEHCCQGSFTADASGQRRCGCQPNGGACTTATAASCCSGSCDGAICQIPPSAPCPRTCTGCCDANGSCQPGSSPGHCGNGGTTCAACSGTSPLCLGSTCHACAGDGECQAAGQGDHCCGDGSCGACCGDPDCSGATPICQDHTCVACTATSQCPANTLCDASGACLACDITCPSSPCTGNPVQAFITAHPAQTVFRICAGTYVGDIVVPRDLTLIGAGDGNGSGDTILQGTGVMGIRSRSVLLIAANNQDVTLRDLRITGGFGTRDPSIGGLLIGGGIQHHGRKLTMAGCTVTGNSARDAGGGVWSGADTTVVMTNCTISDNHLFGTGFLGGLGAGIYSGGPTTLTDCFITTNATGSEGGGGGFVNRAAATLMHTVITDNSASSMGGGIWSFTELTLVDTVVSNNRAITGAGIFANEGTLRVMNDSRITGNICQGNIGGGICSDDGVTVIIDASSVSGNTASEGGGINNGGTLKLLNGSSVTGNTATRDGGGIWNGGSGAVVNASSVTGNTAASQGGGIFNVAGLDLQAGSSVSGNLPNDCVDAFGASGCS